MLITVTGGTGFIGRHVAAAAAARGHDVRVLGLRGDPVAGASEHIRVDLRDPDGIARAVAGSDVVVHCAAALGGDATVQRAITVDGTRHLLDAMAVTKVRRVIGVSSFAVYDMLALPDNALLDEDAPLEAQPQQRAPYIGAKLEQERLIRTHEPAVEWIMMRPGLVFGPGRTWFHHLGLQLPGGMWVCLAPDATLPLTHVSNCADAVLAAAESETGKGATLNVVDDELPTRRDYMNELRAVSGARMAAVPWALLDGAASASAAINRALGGRLPLPGLLSPADLHARCKPLRYSNDRLHSLGWSPAIPWRAGLTAAVAP